jgi:heptosyltransferase-2
MRKMQPQNILIIQPSWVGDAVMATPALRAIRQLYPSARISYLCRRYVKPVFTGLPYANRLITYRTGKTPRHGSDSIFEIAARLRKGKFDTALLLTNSFKTALLCKMAGIKTVVGYERDGRGFLLTDRLVPNREKGKFIPSPMLNYYLGIAHYLGSRNRDLRMELAITAQEKRQAQEVLIRSGMDSDINKPHAAGQGPLVMINAGAQYGAAKCWLPEHFAAVADRLVEKQKATILLSGTARERRILDAIQRHMTHSAVDLSSRGLNLGGLKEIVRRCDLMITNDTGPRHIAAAFGVPVVTVFGPTHQAWTDIYFPLERKIQKQVFCGPCQKKTCPLDHRCMKEITPDAVYALAGELLSSPQLASP